MGLTRLERATLVVAVAALVVTWSFELARHPFSGVGLAVVLAVAALLVAGRRRRRAG
jgi:hypothetical protein